jgi:hypothetical protein
LDDGESVMSYFNKLLICLLVCSSCFANDDILFPKQWNLLASGQHLQRDLDDLHSESLTATGVTNWGYDYWINEYSSLSKRNVVIAVLDSGIDTEHPDLQGSLLPGINFARDKNEKEDNVHDYTGHGTHVAGVIAAQNNTIGISGFGKFVKILPVKIFHKNELKYKQSPLSVRITKGIRYAIKKKVDIINLSLGWPKLMHSKELQKAIEEAISSGIIIVSASGNSSNIAKIYPCVIKEVVCVGSVDANNKLSSFSNYGQNVDVLAPGEMILSTYPTTITPLKFSIPGYEIMSGTSQAAPLISGMIGILISSFPDKSVDEIKSMLFASTKKSNFSLFGIPDLKKAIEAKLKVVFPVAKVKTNFVVNNNNEFTLDIPFTFYKTSQAEVQISSDHISFDKTNFKLDLENNKLQVIGTVTSDNKNLQFQITVSERIFSFFVEVSKNANNELESLIIKSKTKQALLVKNNIQLISKLKIVTSLETRSPKALFYYYNQKNKSISLYKEINHELLNFRDFKLSEKCSLLRFIEIDINQDKNEDYLIESYCKKDDGAEYLEYTFFNSNFSEIHPPVKFLPETSLLNYKNIVFNSIHNSIQITFSAKGKIPVGSENQDPWADIDNSTKLRLYQLISIEGEFKTRLLNDYKFDININETDYSIKHILLSDHASLFLISKENKNQLLKVNLSFDGNILSKEIIASTGLIGQSSFVKINSDLLALENFYTPFKARINLLDVSKNSFENSITIDTSLRNPILNTITYFTTDNLKASVIRSYKYLHFFISSFSQKFKETKIPYGRLDFLGIQKLQEKVTSIKRDDEFIGSLIVDGTQISENSLKVYNFKSSGIIKSHFYSLPKNCATIGLTKSHKFFVNYLCIDSGRVMLKKLTLQ